MTDPIEIAVGHLASETGETLQAFSLWLIGDLEVELHHTDGSGQVIRVDCIGGHEIAEAIQQATGSQAKIDYQASRLSWSGGLRPVGAPGPLQTRRVRSPRRAIRVS
jgi:hypothetical protein